MTRGEIRRDSFCPFECAKVSCVPLNSICLQPLHLSVKLILFGYWHSNVNNSSLILFILSYLITLHICVYGLRFRVTPCYMLYTHVRGLLGWLVVCFLAQATFAAAQAVSTKIQITSKVVKSNSKTFILLCLA